MVHHLMGDLHKAIVKYHEVRSSTSRLNTHPNHVILKSLSIDPINPHILELLNIALESTAVLVPPQEAMDQEVKQAVRKMQDKYARLGWKKKGKEKAGATTTTAAANTDMLSGTETQAAMNIG